MKRTSKIPLIIVGILIVLGVGAASTYLWMGREVNLEGSNVIFITASSLRPDHLSCYGYEHIETGAIDGLAEKGVLFENAYASVPSNLYGYASILTGKNAGEVIIKRGDYIDLDPSSRLISEYLSARGYVTLAVTSSIILSRETNFKKGFDIFDNVLDGLPKEEFDMRIEKATDRAIKLLEEKSEEKKPFFMWIEYSIPNSPNKVPDSFQLGAGDLPYDREVLFLNQQVANITEALKKLNLDKKTIVVFTAANGTSFNEHDEDQYGVFIYDSTVKVPLIISAPGFKPIKTEALASLTDVTPTVLDLLNVDYDMNNVDGKNLAPEFKGETRSRFLYLESLIGRERFGWSPVVGIVTSAGYKYIELPEPELYDLDKDPYELKNIALEEEKKASGLKKTLLDYLGKNRPELLGVINAGSDPKTVISLIRPRQFKTNNIDSVIEYYRQLLEKDPDNKAFKFVIARLYFQFNKLENAREELLNLVGQDPDNNKAWEMLGMCYTKMEQNDKASECYKNALEINPNMPVSLNNLSWYYSENNIDLDKALTLALKANELAPNFPAFMDTLAEAYIKTGEPEKGLELLKKAVELDPKNEGLKGNLEKYSKEFGKTGE